MNTNYDNLERYCPRLGHPIQFSYCRCEQEEKPCGRILDCWWEKFDIQDYVLEHFGQETLAFLNNPPQDKRVSLLDLIEKARRNTARD